MFNSKESRLHNEDTIRQDEFKTVEPAINFRQMTCYTCGHTAVYRFKTKQIRRSVQEPEHNGNREILEKWKSIPRFAEIPEAVKCEGCGEILGSYPEIIY